ncbi:MAG TPA: sigma-70 family RNA polymerase sigma factor [Planctomycetota bacterium]|nr:sigma-70 family RNA polymerase sigma factor [Planctomycetota bacterium]
MVEDFPNTTWGVAQALRPQDPGYRQHVEKLCRRYLAPIRSYAKAAWACGGQDADDLVQDFFVWLLESNVLEKYESERGSFRHFLKALLRNFSRNQRQASQRLKRGGGKEHVPLDDGDLVADPRTDEAEAAFDRSFTVTVTNRTLARLRETVSKGKRATQWRIFEEHDLAKGPEPPSYKELARRHGVSEKDVRNYLHRMRNLVRDAIRVELAETVATTEQLEEEWRRVLG